MQVHWRVMHIRADTFAAKLLEEPAAVETGAEANDVEMIAMRDTVADRERREPGFSRERVVILAGDRLPALHPGRQFLELAGRQCALNIGETVVVAEAHHLVSTPALFLALT